MYNNAPKFDYSSYALPTIFRIISYFKNPSSTITTIIYLTPSLRIKL